MPYHYLEDIATADVAFNASGGTREELFAAAAAALMKVMIHNPEEIVLRETIPVTLSGTELDLLLFSFLQELVFYKDARQLLLTPQKISIYQTEEHYSLTGELAGERIDPPRHQMGVDVKAVTLHLFQVVETETGWEATVILDI